jgi:glucosamine-6-phosphate deaminase
MERRVFQRKQELGEAAARHAAGAIRRAIEQHGRARILAATGASQFEFLAALIAAREVDWSRVELFHLDEYIGIGADHPASFQRYIRERLIQPTGITRYHLLDGLGDPAEVCARVGAELSRTPIDCAFCGIGENGHLAFNDPPADFDTPAPYLVVALDDACRWQQVGEGWFASPAEVPTHAISISIRQLLAAREIICVVPDARKAQAVRACLEGPVSPAAPASILQTHPSTTIYLDTESAALLRTTDAR